MFYFGVEMYSEFFVDGLYYLIFKISDILTCRMACRIDQY